MQARVKWVQDVMFVTESGSGHAVVVDGAPEYGGRNMGPRPMELLLMGMGGCTAFDVVTILKKARQDVTGCEATLETAVLSGGRGDALKAVPGVLEVQSGTASGKPALQVTFDPAQISLAALQDRAGAKALTGAAFCFGLRLLSLRRGWHLPVATPKPLSPAATEAPQPPRGE